MKEKTEQTEEIKSAIDKLTEKIDSNVSIELLYERAALLIKQNEFAKAINDFNKIIALDENQNYAKTQVDFLQTILKYNNTDIYANPNTNFDPWLE